MDQLFVGSGLGIGEIVTVSEIIVDQEPAQFDAEILLSEGLVGQMSEGFVSVLNAIGSGPGGELKSIGSSRPRGAEASRGGGDQSGILQLISLTSV